MVEKCAEIGRVGKLEAEFQQVLLVQFFWYVHDIVMKILKKKKKCFLDLKQNPKYHFTTELA